MNTHATDREVFRAVLAEHAWEHAGEHPDHDALVAYLTGELDTEAEARVNDHLVACLLHPRELHQPALESVDGPGRASLGEELRSSWTDLGVSPSRPEMILGGRGRRKGMYAVEAAPVNSADVS